MHMLSGFFAMHFTCLQRCHVVVLTSLLLLIKTSQCNALTQSSQIGAPFQAQTNGDSHACTLDIVLLQDTTLGLESDLKSIAAEDNLGQLVKYLDESFPGSRLGLLSFRDKPIWSLGTEDGDYCAKLETDLTTDFSTFRKTYESLSTYGGGDFWENQLGALALAGQTSKFSWRSPGSVTKLQLVKLFVLITDSAPHHEADGKSNVYPQLKKPFTPVLDDNDWDTKCISEDYPSAENVKEILKEKQIETIFVTNDNSVSPLTDRAYSWFNGLLGQPAEFFVNSGNHSEKFFPALKVALDKLKQNKCDAGCDIDPTTQPPSNEGTEALQKCLLENKVEAVAYWQGSPEYASGIEPLDLYYETQYPLVYTKVRETEEVSAILRCTEKTGHNVIVRGGGHDYADYSFGKHGDVIIDLHLMTNLTIDQTTGEVEVGAGMKVSPFQYQLFKKGEWMIPAGACTAVGIGGHFQGGGYGYHTRAYGLAADYMIGAEIVLANGTIVQAVPGTDLFWAIQGGGGGNVGVVTKYRMQAFKAPPVVSSMSLYYSSLETKRVLYAALDFYKIMPKNLALSLLIDARGVPIQLAYIGNLTEMRKVLKPFLDASGVGVETSSEGSYLDSVGELSILNIMDTETPVAIPPVVGRLGKNGNNTDVPADEQNGPILTGGTSRKVLTLEDLNTAPDFRETRTYFKPHSLIWTDEVPLTKECVDIILAATRLPPLNFGMALEIMGGDNSALRWKSWNETGFSLRNMSWIAHMYARSLLPLSPLDLQYVDNVFAKVKKCAAPRTYVNYKDPDLGEDSRNLMTGVVSGDAPKALMEYHGEYHLKRLQDIKQKYNPKNQFWHPQAIRLSE